MKYGSKSLKTTFNEIEEQYKRVPHRKNVFRIATLFFIVFTIFISFIVNGLKKNGNEKAVREYLSTQNEEVIDEYFENDAVRGNAEALAKFEEATLGISNNTALSGLSWNCDANLEYRNVIDNIEAYRCQDTGELAVAVDGQNISIDQFVVDEIIATRENIFFINTEDGCLWEYSIEKNESNKLTDIQTNQFAVIGDQIYILTDSSSIVRYSLSDSKTYDVVTNVQRFYVAGNLMVQSGVDIVSIALDGSSHNTLVSNGLIVGANDNSIYYIDFGKSTGITDIPTVNGVLVDLENLNKLYEMHVDTRQIDTVTWSEGFIRAAYYTDNGIVIDEIN